MPHNLNLGPTQSMAGEVTTLPRRSVTILRADHVISAKTFETSTWKFDNSHF